MFVVRGSNAAGELESQATERVTVWNRSEVDQWQFENSLEQFLQVRKQNPYPYSFDSDLCSSPEWARLLTSYQQEVFADSCKRHDFGFQNFGRRLRIDQQEYIRDRINRKFLDDMIDSCADEPPALRLNCQTVADAFYVAVSLSPQGYESFHEQENFSWDSDYDNPES